MTDPAVLFLHVGTCHHGVNRYGRQVAAAVADRSAAARQVGLGRGADEADCAQLRQRLSRDRPDVVHAHFTDQLYGRTPDQAVEALGRLIDACDPCPVVLTLHDLPPVAGGGDREARRRTAYARAAHLADRVVVSSQHERRRLVPVSDVDAEVVPLLVPRRRSAVTLPSGRRPRTEVGVLGFVYPGKGHEEVIDACGSLRPSPSVVALGRPSALHDDLAVELRWRAAGRNVRFAVTGWLEDDELDRRVDDVAVPVVANRDVSASGSLCTWLGAGRRPLVRACDYTREMAELAPDCLHLYEAGDPGILADAIRWVARRPALTRQDAVPRALRPDGVAEAHLQVFGAVA